MGRPDTRGNTAQDKYASCVQGGGLIHCDPWVPGEAKAPWESLGCNTGQTPFSVGPHQLGHRLRETRLLLLKYQLVHRSLGLGMATDTPLSGQLGLGALGPQGQGSRGLGAGMSRGTELHISERGGALSAW